MYLTSNASSAREGWSAWVVVAILGVVILFVPFQQLPSRTTQRYFRIEATTSAFSPAVLRVNPGDQVTIELVAKDVVHGLSVDGYNLKLSADPGQPQKITFRANQAGVFHLRCSVPCGPLHPFITGRLVVGQNWVLLRGIGLVVLAVLVAVFLPFRKALTDQKTLVLIE